MTTRVHDLDYLDDVFELMRPIRIPTVDEYEAFVASVTKEPVHMALLAKAYERLVRDGDQLALQQVIDDRAAANRAEAMWLSVVFHMLGERGIAPFDSFESYIPDMSLKRATSVPAGLEPFIALGARIGITDCESALLEQVETMPPDDLEKLRALGKTISADRAFADRTIQWLRDEEDTTDALVVHRILYMLDALGYEW